MPSGKGYVFSGSAYVRYSAPPGNPDAVAGDDTPDEGYPKSIWNIWGGFWAADLDAAVAWPDGYTYFFKGTEYVPCLPNSHVAEHPPRPIENMFPGVLDAFPYGIDAAVVWSSTKAYFFKGSSTSATLSMSDAMQTTPRRSRCSLPSSPRCDPRACPA